MPTKRTATIKPCRAEDKDPKRPASEQKVCLYTKDGKRLLGRHPDKEAARKQEIAIKARGGALTAHGGKTVKKTAATLEPVSAAGIAEWLEWVVRTIGGDIDEELAELFETGSSIDEIAALLQSDVEAMYPLYEDSTPMHDEDPLAFYLGVGDMYTGTIAEVDGQLFFTTEADLREHFEEEGTLYPEGRNAATKTAARKRTSATKRSAKTAALKSLLAAGFVPPTIKQGGKTWVPDLSDPTTAAAWKKSQKQFSNAPKERTAATEGTYDAIEEFVSDRAWEEVENYLDNAEVDYNDGERIRWGMEDAMQDASVQKAMADCNVSPKLLLANWRPFYDYLTSVWADEHGYTDIDYEPISKMVEEWGSAYEDNLKRMFDRLGLSEEEKEDAFDHFTSDSATWFVFLDEEGWTGAISEQPETFEEFMDEHSLSDEDFYGGGGEESSSVAMEASWSGIGKLFARLLTTWLEDHCDTTSWTSPEQETLPLEARFKRVKTRIGRKLRSAKGKRTMHPRLRNRTANRFFNPSQRRAQGEFYPDDDTILEMIDEWTWEDVESFMGDRFSKEDDFYSLRQVGEEFDENAYQSWLESNWDRLVNTRAAEDYFEQQVSEVKPKIDAWVKSFDKKVSEVASKLEPEQRERLFEILNEDPARSTWLVFMAEAGHGIGLSDDYDLDEVGIDEDDLFPTGYNSVENDEISMIPYYVGGWIINTNFDEWQEEMGEE
jgi:hypothetical protein